MEIKKAKRIIATLAEGIDTTTGELLDAENVLAAQLVYIIFILKFKL